MANNTQGGHSGPNWGLIVTVIVALIGGTWALSGEFSDVDDRIDGVAKALEDSIRAVRNGIAKLNLPATKSEGEPITEAAFDDPLPGVLEELCAEDTSTENVILVGGVVTGTLDESDDRMDDETYFDSWILPVCEGGLITIEMTSDTLDRLTGIGAESHCRRRRWWSRVQRAPNPVVGIGAESHCRRRRWWSRVQRAPNG